MIVNICLEKLVFLLVCLLISIFDVLKMNNVVIENSKIMVVDMIVVF